MTENNNEFCRKNKHSKSIMELPKDHKSNKERQPSVATKEESTTSGLCPAVQCVQTSSQSQTHHTSQDRCKKRSQFLDLLGISRHHHHWTLSSGSSCNVSAQQSPLTPYAVSSVDGHMEIVAIKIGNGNDHTCGTSDASTNELTEKQCRQYQQLPLQDPQKHVQEQQQNPRAPLYHTTCLSFHSGILLLDITNGEMKDITERSSHKDEFGTQRVYKKTSPNCVLTLYLPSREITLSGNSPSILRGIVYVDPKAIHGYRVYSQLTLTFRYGREDEEVMGLRFCNEAIMSLHQIWPRNDEPLMEALSPLQEALLKRLGDGAHPFTLTLTAQAPPSVQLVPAKRYYGAPIGTSYDVRCFIADKTDEKFHRRASVKMGVRVIYRTDVFNNFINGPEHFADLVNNTAVSPPTTLSCFQPHSLDTAALPSNISSPSAKVNTTDTLTKGQVLPTPSNKGVPVSSLTATDSKSICGKSRKSERGDSFPKLRLSPKSFRLSSRFGRSKSEAEKCPNDPFYNYSKSFQEYDSGAPGVTGGGPQGVVDKPFLLQDGRVGLRASLNKAWYTHDEDVCVTINIRNDSRKTVRKIRVCAIQHVDVCMFNNGKFKNVVADSDNISPPPIDRIVSPGGTLNTTVTLKPQRGPTKNWIALEDTLQRSTEPEDITGLIAASAVRTPHFQMQTNHSPKYCSSPASFIPPILSSSALTTNPSTNDERNVFAIYVSYYVKVKLTLSGMGGELSLKLPFMLVHIDEDQRHMAEQQIEKLALDDVPAHKKTCNKTKTPIKVESCQEFAVSHSLDRIESVEDDNMYPKESQVISVENNKSVVTCQVAEDVHQRSTSSNNGRRRLLMRSETIAKDLDDDSLVHADAQAETEENLEHVVHVVQVHSTNRCDDQPDQKNQNDQGSITAQVSHEFNTNQIQPTHVSATLTCENDTPSNVSTAEQDSTHNV